MITKDELITKVYEFKFTLYKKNYAVSKAIDNTLIPLLEYKGDLENIAEGDLLLIKGIGAKSARYLFKILHGESIDSVIATVPVLLRTPYHIQQGERRWNFRDESGSSWDNAVRFYEGE